MNETNDSPVTKFVPNGNDSENENDNFMDELPEDVKSVLKYLSEECNCKTRSTVVYNKETGSLTVFPW